MKYAQVVVNTTLSKVITQPRVDEPAAAESLRERVFTYSIPTHLQDQIAVGQMVWVPFGARRLQGIIVGLSNSSPVAETKDIQDIVDSRPFLSEAQIDLAGWIAKTYLCSLNDAIQLMLPPGIEQETETWVALVQGAPLENLTPKQVALVEVLKPTSQVKSRAIPSTLRSAIDPLVQRGIITKRNLLSPLRAKPKRVKSVRLRDPNALANIASKNSPADILDYLALAENVSPTIDAVCVATRCPKSTLRSLAKKKWIEVTQTQELVALSSQSSSKLTDKQLSILAYLRERGAPVPLSELKSKAEANTATLRGLESKACIERIYQPSSVRLIMTPRDAIQKARELRGIDRLEKIVDFLRGEKNPVWISAVYAATDCTLKDLQKLEAAGVVALEEEEVWRDPLAGRTYDVVFPPKLTLEQEAAWEKIVASLWSQVTGHKSHVTADSQLEALDLKPATCYLLHGVTGSGKTEIYLRALAETIAQGKQGIALVPEISLTPQTIRRFGARFNANRLAVLHSRLSLGERYDTWRRCRDGQIDVVIGSRSALFAPLPRLGLIVMDEEHEPAYKQEATPHYHAREVALELAKRVGAVVILGSATPDLETYYRARRGEFKLLELPKRIMGHTRVIEKEITNYELRTLAPHASAGVTKLAVRELDAQYADARYLDLPPVDLVDLRAELKTGNRSMFSRALQREMARVLAAREQIILFLNRRGTATFILCRDCGNVFKCKRCDNPMTYHQGDLGHGLGDQLVCHHCNRRDRVPTKCPNCASARIRFFGVGTQKVEDEIQSMFPKARTLRWDFDVTRGKESHEEILTKFVEHQADVLIGTQMIAKGLDLPLVTLVGVISADTALNLPDFRAGERTFQLLTQVAGRAGRSILGGKVIIQTYNPEHYAIQAAAKHDYDAFYDREFVFRRQQGYPPFNRLIRLLYSHTNEKRAQEESTRMHLLLMTRIAQRGLPSIDLIGPAPAFFHRVRGEYRYHILVRGIEPHALIQDIALPLGWRVDVDPVSVL